MQPVGGCDRTRERAELIILQSVCDVDGHDIGGRHTQLQGRRPWDRATRSFSSQARATTQCNHFRAEFEWNLSD